MENHKDYKLKSGNILRVIQQDETPESPNMWENEDVFLVYDHRSFNVKRKGFEPKHVFEYLENCHEQIEDDRYNDYFIFLVYAHIHSGISLSLKPNGNIWDTSTTGYILVEKNQVTQGEKDKESEQDARNCAEGLIEIWNQYLSGDVYGFQVLKPIVKMNINLIELQKLVGKDNVLEYSLLLEKMENNVEHEEINSCSGFYGDDPKINGMLENINDEIIE